MSASLKRAFLSALGGGNDVRPPSARAHSPTFLTVLILIMLTLAGCGGSSSGTSSGSSNQPVPAELLYTTGGSLLDNKFEVFSIDPTTGLPGSPVVQAGIKIGASAISPSGRFYYTSEEFTPGINVYTIGHAGDLTLIPGSPFTMDSINDSFGVDPAMCAFDPAGMFLYLPGPTGENTIDVLSIDQTTGALTEVPGAPFSNGSGNFYPNHMVISPSGDFLYIVDGAPYGYPGTAGVSGYSVDRNTGSLTPIVGGSFTYSNNSTYFSGAAGITIDSSGKFLYFSEVDGIHGFTIEQSTGALNEISSSPLVSLPSLTQLTAHPAMSNLYAAIGDGTIAAYSIDATSGTLTEIAGSPYRVFPNPAPATLLISFILDPPAKFLYVLTIDGSGSSATQGIGAYSIDPANGGLRFIGVAADPQGRQYPNERSPFIVAKLP